MTTPSITQQRMAARHATNPTAFDDFSVDGRVILDYGTRCAFYFTQLAAGIPAAVVLDVEALTHTTVEAYAKYIARVVKKESTRKVKRADILANLSDNPTEAQVIRYAKALLMITDAPGVKLT